MDAVVDQSVARQYQRYVEADAKARKLWDQADRELEKLVRAAKLGRKHAKTIAISENRGVEIEDQFRQRGAVKIFTPAFCKRYKLKEVPLNSN